MAELALSGLKEHRRPLEHANQDGVSKAAKDY